MPEEFQPVVFTSLSLPQFQILLRSELETYFKTNPILSSSGQDDDLILDIDEAAAYIKLSIPSIYRLAGENTLPVIKKGKKLLFSKKALTAWLMDGRKKTLKEIQKEASTT